MATYSSILAWRISMDMKLSKLWELVMTRKTGMLQFMGSQIVGHRSD